MLQQPKGCDQHVFQHIVNGKPTEVDPYPVPANSTFLEIKGRKGSNRSNISITINWTAVRQAAFSLTWMLRRHEWIYDWWMFDSA